MSCLFSGCCIRLFRGARGAPSLNHSTAESVDPLLSRAPSVQDDRATADSPSGLPIPDSARPESTHSVPQVDPENVDQGTHDIVISAVQEGRAASIDPISDTRSGSSLENVQPETQFSGTSPAPLHPAPESPAGTVSDSESHTSDDATEFTELREKCGRFRVLVLGRANAGKTTLLKAVCGADGDPEILKEDDDDDDDDDNDDDDEDDEDDEGNSIVVKKEGGEDGDSGPALQGLLSPTAERGEHNINTPLVFPSNPGFIFHDSRGFEAGSDEELQAVTNFLRSKGNERSLRKQLHAIWYCIPTDNEARLLSGPEQELLKQCSIGPVPLVVIFTKLDSLEAKAFQELKGTGLTRQQAQQRAPQHAITKFQSCYLPCLFGEIRHPKYMFLRKMHKGQNKAEIQGKMAELIQLTVDAVDVDALKLLLVSVQRNNLQLLIVYAVRYGGIGQVAKDVLATGDVDDANGVDRLLVLLAWFQWPLFCCNKLESENWRMWDQDDDDDDQEAQWDQWDQQALDEAQARHEHLEEHHQHHDADHYEFPEHMKAFHSEIHINLPSFVGSLPTALHVPTLAIGILIVSAQLFWHKQGQEATPSEIKTVIGLYLTSGRANKVRAQVEEELGAIITQYYTRENADALIKITLENLGEF